MKFLITITKEVIDKSAYCGKGNAIATSCAFAVAYGELIPNAFVFGSWVDFRNDSDYFAGNLISEVHLDNAQREFIKNFDSMTPEARYSLVGREFEVEIPDSVIEYWHGDAVKAVKKIIDNPILKPLELV